MRQASLLLAVSWPLLVSSFTFPDCTKAPLNGNVVCDTTKDALTRATGLINLFTTDELINNTINSSPGVSRLGLSSYQWWSEALHGLASGHGVSFAGSGNFSSATSFPQPILMSAAFDDDLIKRVATVVSTEARAFSNSARAGLDFWTPNINPFKDPRWGRGQETPGEDPFRVSGYVYNLIQGLEGGIDPSPFLKVAATCKHFAAYDLENWQHNSRTSFNAIVSQQDLSEYYLPPFQSCVRDAKVSSIMCSYNAVNGVPACADPFLLQTILRDFWKFGDDRWVVSDCDAINNIFNDHHYTTTFPESVADSLKAGTDINCGGTYNTQLPAALNQSLVTVQDLKSSLVRQYASLVRLGYFDPAASQPYRKLSWSDVNTDSSKALAIEAAASGIVLLKNDGTLPLSASTKTLAIIGPWANATAQMQGNYFGVAPFLTSTIAAATAAGYTVSFAPGTGIASNDTSGFAAAVSIAKAANAVIYAGGIDETIEKESLDRNDITWPGNQLALIAQLETVGKPLIVVQFGGGQVDSTVLKSSASVNAIIWAGYPGQSGGTAVMNILSGKTAPAGRLPVTAYPAEYVTQVPMTDMSLRSSSTNPGRTYMWYTKTPVFPFGFGLHYTTFSFTWTTGPQSSYNIQTLVQSGSSSEHLDLAPFASFTVGVKNTGKVTSDYVALLFASGTYGPAPHPNKQLISYARAKSIAPNAVSNVVLKVTLGAIARADANGSFWVYPGSYKVALDTTGLLTASFTLQGNAAQLTQWPQPN